MSGEDAAERVTLLRVVWTPHGDHEPDWSYHLRMGDIDCDEAHPIDVTGRVVHLKRDHYDVRIDRATRWGNPFVIGHDGVRATVIAKYREWVTSHPDAEWIRGNVHTLRGKTLGCWCAPDACHGDVLLELAALSQFGRHSQGEVVG